jgi:hypothetical protein
MKQNYTHLIGKMIVIVYMEGEPHMTGRLGEVEYVDDANQLHGTWGGLAVQPDHDQFIIVDEQERGPAHD